MNNEDQQADPASGHIDTEFTMAKFRQTLDAPQKAIEESLESVEFQLTEASKALVAAQSKVSQMIKNSDTEAAQIVATAVASSAATIDAAKKKASELRTNAELEAAKILSPEATRVPEIMSSAEPSGEEPLAAEPHSPVAHEEADLCESCKRAMKPKPHFKAVIILVSVVVIGWIVLFFMLRNMSPGNANILATILTWVGAFVAIGSLVFLVVESDKSRPWSSRRDMGIKGWTSLFVSIIGIAISCAGLSLLQL